MLSSCFRQFARRVSLLPVRSTWTTPKTRSIKYTPTILRFDRFNSTASSERLQAQGLPVPIDDDETHTLIQRAEQVWPCPPHTPPGWSSTWRTWSYLLTFYYPSSYFLMLPQIEMLLNIRYRIPGEARPVLFSNHTERVIFTLVDQHPRPRFFLCDVPLQTLAEFTDVDSVEELVGCLEGDPDWQTRLRVLVPNEEGEACLDRILARDSTVIPVLAEKFLDYVPEETKECDERPELDLQLDDADAVQAMESLLADMDASPSFREAQKLQKDSEG